MRWDKNIRVPTRSETSGCSLPCVRMLPGIDSTYSLSSILSLGLVVPDLVNLCEYIGKNLMYGRACFTAHRMLSKDLRRKNLCFVAVLGDMNVVGKRQRIVKLKRCAC